MSQPISVQDMSIHIGEMSLEVLQQEISTISST